MVPDGPKHIPPYISRNQSSLGELLLGFLKYYATSFRYKDTTLLSLVFRLLIYLLPFHVPCPFGQLLLPLQSPPSLLFLSLSCILFFGFMFLGEGREQVGPLALHRTNMTYHGLCVCSIWVCVSCHSFKVELKLNAKHKLIFELHCISFCFYLNSFLM